VLEKAPLGLGGDQLERAIVRGAGFVGPPEASQ
jgi:hypothetical protein